jgi:hypothetical protein
MAADAPMQEQPAEGQAGMVSIDEVLGSSVVNENGEEVGTIEDRSLTTDPIGGALLLPRRHLLPRAPGGRHAASATNVTELQISEIITQHCRFSLELLS